MQFPESWLREFCDPPLSTQALAHLLTMSGMEVEDLRPVAPPFTGVVVAEIVDVAPHPKADRLRVCSVVAGLHTPDGPLQIVCGAPNARAGLRAPLALAGARLPPGDDGQPVLIAAGVVRGVESRGMLCSAKELGISDDPSGLLELAADSPPGADLRQHLALDDTLFILKLTPNLGHLLSVYGVAREVSALTGAPLKSPAIAAVAPVHTDTLAVEVLAPELCGRFSGRVVRHVDTRARTPRWMVDRLSRCGQRSVNALVDISNYVMFEYGRPSHIFDLEKIRDKLVVRWGRKGETLELLNGSTVEVDETVGVIADAGAVESLAGIMGGEATAVSDQTRHVYVEAAFWWPDAVAGRSRRYGFSTDAGHRFERGVDPAQTVAHIERITQLILEVCGGAPGPMDDHVARLPERRPVTLRVARAAKVIGMPLTQRQCADVLARLGLACSEGDGTLTVTPPSWRFDLLLEEDLIEEVIRVVGYDHLPDTPTLAPTQPRRQLESRRPVSALRHQMVSLDYQEVISFSFVEERWERELAGNADPIRVLNPIAAPLAVMRSTLIGSLLATLRSNLARRASRVRLFEIGRVYRRDTGALEGPRAVAGVAQPLRLGGLAYGSADALQWGASDRRVDFHDMKGDIEALLAPRRTEFNATVHPALHPGRAASITVAGRTIGHIGELHPRWCQAYELQHAALVFELDVDALLERPLPAHRPLPRQQPVWRDLALVVGETVCHDRLVQCLRDDTSGLVRQVTLFDVFRPRQDTSGWAAGEKSMAVRVELLDEAHTMTDARIDELIAAAVERAVVRLGARLRS
jgi:phenylalanyl-tRNA synthetase beta chain